jgi:putrescine transport system substrate-binding protein
VASKTCSGGLGLLLLAAVPATGAAAEERVVNVYSWADYIGATTVADFERETGIEVNYDTYDSSETVDTKLLAGSTGYDVVFHDMPYSSRLIPIGIYRPLRHERLAHWRGLDPAILERYAAYDPGNRHGVPYMWGSTGFAYNVDLISARMPDAPVTSGDMLFKPEVVARFADCGVSFLDSPSDVVPMALAYLGYSADSTVIRELEEAERLLKAVRPYVRYFSSAKMLLDLPNSEICVAMSWSGDYATARDRALDAGVDVRLAYSVPREGSIGWYDAMFIPADAPHPDNAYRFIDFVLRPDVIAAITNLISYANAVPASRPFIDAQILADPAIYPTPEVLDVLEPKMSLPPKIERLRTRIMARVKSGL